MITVAILLPVDNRRYFTIGTILDNRLVLTINRTKLLDYRKNDFHLLFSSLLGSNYAVPYLGHRIEEGFLNIVKSGMWHFQMMIRSHSYLLRGSSVILRICCWKQVSWENQFVTENLVRSCCSSFLPSLVQTVPV